MRFCARTNAKWVNWVHGGARAKVQQEEPSQSSASQTGQPATPFCHIRTPHAPSTGKATATPSGVQHVQVSRHRNKAAVDFSAFVIGFDCSSRHKHRSNRRWPHFTAAGFAV